MEKASGERLVLESRNDKSLVNVMSDKKLASVIDYFYFTVKNPDDENMELGKINIYFASPEADTEHLNIILKKKALQNFSVMVVLDFEKYWNIADNIPKWLSYINEKVAPSMMQLDLDSSDNLKKRLEDIVMNYSEPVTTEGGDTLNRISDISPEKADNLLLPTGCLTPNYGFPIIFAVNKCDHIL